MRDIYVDFLKNIGFEPLSYSGRGMFGKSCVGVVVPSTSSALFKIGYELGKMKDSEDFEELKDGFESLRTDTMGLEYIVYFPDIEWLEHDDEF
jgi:hypothetical protein